MNFTSNNRFSLTTINIVLMTFLLCTIFFVMILPPTIQKVVYQFMLSGILISAFFCIDAKYHWYMRWLVGITILLLWAYLLTGNFILGSISKSLTVCLYITIAVWLVKQAASSKTVTRVVILESLNGYLMIGMFYSVIIALIMSFDPGAFHFQNAIKDPAVMVTNFNEYLYYGFNAFTTVTYGDVLPVSSVAKSVSMAMGFTGEMYTVIIIAMLVGKYAGKRQESREKEKQ